MKIEMFNFMGDKWNDSAFDTLKEFVEAHTRGDKPCRLVKTNQESFDMTYFYFTDVMGHDFWCRMFSPDFDDQWYEIREEQIKDYEIFTDENGYVSKTPHIICGKCLRCKTCGDCKCKDKHKR